MQLHAKPNHKLELSAVSEPLEPMHSEQGLEESGLHIQDLETGLSTRELLFSFLGPSLEPCISSQLQAAF